MSQKPTRQPLHERIEGLAKRRKSFILLLLALLALRLIVSATNWSVETNRAQAVIGLIVTAVLLLVLVLAAAVSRLSGDATRQLPGRWMTTPTRWANLNRALEHYEVRTGAAPPRTAVLPMRQTRGGADAELIYLNRSQPPAIVSPLKATAAHTPGIIFTRQMLTSYGSDELLAVILHLTERGQLSRGADGKTSNGVSEADSRALLITHDHRALLRAIEKADRGRETPPSDIGRVRFADADLHAILSLKEPGGTRWETRDRMAELRTHLGVAALDVPTET